MRAIRENKIYIFQDFTFIFNIYGNIVDENYLNLYSSVDNINYYIEYIKEQYTN